MEKLFWYKPKIILNACLFYWCQLYFMAIAFFCIRNSVCLELEDLSCCSRISKDTTALAVIRMKELYQFWTSQQELALVITCCIGALHFLLLPRLTMEYICAKLLTFHQHYSDGLHRHNNHVVPLEWATFAVHVQVISAAHTREVWQARLTVYRLHGVHAHLSVQSTCVAPWPVLTSFQILGAQTHKLRNTAISLVVIHVLQIA